jgi:hypothetical protein
MLPLSGKKFQSFFHGLVTMSSFQYPLLHFHNNNTTTTTLFDKEDEGEEMVEEEVHCHFCECLLDLSKQGVSCQYCMKNVCDICSLSRGAFYVGDALQLHEVNDIENYDYLCGDCDSRKRNSSNNMNDSYILNFMFIRTLFQDIEKYMQNTGNPM